MAEDGSTDTKDQKDGDKPAAKAEDTVEFWKAEAEKWKGLSRKHEDQSKANLAELTKLQDAADTSKTDAERAAKRLDDLESQLAASDSRAMRAEVATSKGLSAAQARRLQGATVEELEADADDLLASFKPADKDGAADTADGSGKPKEKMRAGATSDDGAGEDKDVKDILADVPRA